MPTFPVSKAVKPEIIRILKKRFNTDILKKYHDSYRNSWFLIKKIISGKYRIMNAVIYINKIILKNINMFLNVEEFAEEFIRMIVQSLMNLYSEYNQIPLKEKNRNLTVF